VRVHKGRTHWAPRPNLGERSLLKGLRHPGGQLNIARNRVGCLDNIPHPKPTKHGTYKYQKFGTARPSAPADTLADAADPTVARARSSTATAACGAPHGAAFLSARTTNARLTAASSDHHSARTDPATTARQRTSDRRPSAHRPPSRAAAPAGRTTSRCPRQQRTRAEA
jgi:hypothetical protein